MSYAATLEEFRKSSGTFFDPVMTEIMIENIQLFEDIHRSHKD
jgi:response regulator RpfG family c-di-GMP phosphodiesterase